MDVNLDSKITADSKIAGGRSRESKGLGSSSGGDRDAEGGSGRRSGGGVGAQERDVERMDREWEEDLVAFGRYKIMRSGYEEAKQGNTRSTELRQQAAPLVALGGDLQSAERKLLVECYDKAYHKQALEALLITKHPHLIGSNLNKIGHLINAAAGFPAMQEWPQIMARAAVLRQGPNVNMDQDNADSDDDDKDESKAQRHSQTNTAARNRPLSVVKRGRGTGDEKLASSSFASSSFVKHQPTR